MEYEREKKESKDGVGVSKWGGGEGGTIVTENNKYFLKIDTKIFGLSK